MIDQEQIPPEVVEAAAKAIAEAKGWTWERIADRLKVCCRAEARAAIAAALNAWPGMSALQENDSASIREMACLILPLAPKENGE